MCQQGATAVGIPLAIRTDVNAAIVEVYDIPAPTRQPFELFEAVAETLDAFRVPVGAHRLVEDLSIGFHNPLSGDMDEIVLRSVSDMRVTLVIMHTRLGRDLFATMDLPLPGTSGWLVADTSVWDPTGNDVDLATYEQ
jgi:hypothetical protein